MSKVWLDHEEHCLSAESLRALFENEIACIRIKGFATAQESEAFVGAMDDVGLSHEYKVLGPNVKHRPRYLGVPQFEYRKRLKADYFATVERAYAEQRAVFERCRFDALERLSQALRVALPGHSVGVAEEPGYGRYFAGIIRDTTGGTNLHMDYERVSASDYSIAANDAQIATNFYASGTDEGGETTVYNLHFVPPAMPPGQVFEISPFREEWIAGCESHTFKPIPGDLVMFNSRCPHRVHWNPRDDGQRRTGMGTFIGRRPGGDLVLWS